MPDIVPPRRPLFIVNPTAGGSRGVRAVPAVRSVLRDLQIDAELVFSDSPGDAEELARRGAREGYSPVAGVGGDGTLQEIVNGLLREPFPPPLGVVPAGTGNDFARGLRLPTDPAAAARLACTGAPREIDVGLCGERYYLTVGGVGLDAQVSAALSRRAGGGRGVALQYVLCALTQLARYSNLDYTLHLDGSLLHRRSLLIAVGNTRYYGGGMMVCPRATPLDGLLDVCIAGDLSRAEALALLPGFFYGRHLRHPKVEYRRARVVCIEGPEASPIHLDGEPSGALPAEFRVVTRALRVLGATDAYTAPASAPARRLHETAEHEVPLSRWLHRADGNATAV